MFSARGYLAQHSGVFGLILQRCKRARICPNLVFEVRSRWEGLRGLMPKHPPLLSIRPLTTSAIAVH